MAASLAKATAVTMAVAGLGANDVHPGAPFEQALEQFKKGLRPKHRSTFQTTTLPDLLAAIDKIQKEQHSSRRLQAVGRLKPTLEALNQLGKVVETFTNTSEFVAFVWVRLHEICDRLNWPANISGTQGPLKFLIQVLAIYPWSLFVLLTGK